MSFGTVRVAASLLLACVLAGCLAESEPEDAATSPSPVTDSDPVPTTPGDQSKGAITVTVTDADGEPIAGAFVEPAPIDVPGGAGFEEGNYPTDADGEFTFPGLNPGLYEITVRHRTEVIAGPEEVTVEAGETAEVELKRR